MKKTMLATMGSLTLVLVLALTLCLEQVVLADSEGNQSVIPSTSGPSSYIYTRDMPDPIVGTPYSYQLKVMNTGSEETEWAIQSESEPVVTDATAGALQVQQLAAAPVASVSTTYGSLPDGLTLSRSGLISGTPTKVGTWRFVVVELNSNLSTEIVMTVLPGRDDGDRLFFDWEPSENAPMLGGESSSESETPVADANPNTGAY